MHVTYPSRCYMACGASLACVGIVALMLALFAHMGKRMEEKKKRLDGSKAIEIFDSPPQREAATCHSPHL